MATAGVWRPHMESTELRWGAALGAIGAPGSPARVPMRLLGFALLALTLGLFSPTSPASAQARGDILVAKERQEHPDSAVLIFNVSMMQEGKPGCVPLSVELKPEQGRSERVEVNLFTMQRFNVDHFRGALAPLRPGTWTIVRVGCYNHDFNGPIVQIKLAPGEIVNAGHVVVNRVMVDPGDWWTHGPKYAAHIKIEELPANNVESLKERAPETFARAKRRNFAINTALR
ncbi:hypothetical protein ACQR1I_30540 [Bradyrhizobium sp. HKCCYLS2038]|uniref:hypothetical protein n=1 Tax=unclassified Bradyrhizobium TaxID=2631580 RepID=UPI003EBEC785